MTVMVQLSTPGVLVADAAASFERVRKATGTTGTDNRLQAWRSYDDQVTVWYQNMTLDKAQGDGVTAHRRKWNGQWWWRKRGKNSCAIPGQSNHRFGSTVDWQDLGPYGSASWNRMAAILSAHGWNNTEGRSIGEPWHWTYVRANDNHWAPAPPPTPAPPKSKEDAVLIALDNAGRGRLLFGDSTWVFISEGATADALRKAGIPDAGKLSAAGTREVFCGSQRKAAPA